MFKNTGDFRKAKLLCMDAIQKESDGFRTNLTMDPIELYDVLSFLSDNELIKGLHTLDINPNDEVMITSSSLRLSYKGLKEYEDIVPHSTWGEK